MYASSSVLAPSAYSSATPASIRPAAQVIPEGASTSAMVVTRLLPTRTGEPDPGGQLGGLHARHQHHLEAHLGAVGGLERGRRPLRDQLAAGDEGQPVDRLLRLQDVVGHQQHRAALSSQGPDLVPEETAAQRIDVIGRLVEDDQVPRGDRRHAEAHQALDTAGETGAEGLAPLAESSASMSSLVRRRTWPISAPRIRPDSSIASRRRKESIGICAWGR